VAADKQGVIADYRAAYSEFRTAVEGLSEEQMTRPFMDGWGVREVVAHIAGWHEQMATGLERIAQGQRPTPEGVDWNDIQAWNDRFAQGAASSAAVGLIQQLDGDVQRLIAALEALPDDRFGEGKTAVRMAGAAGFEHFREHAAELNEARAAGKI
jgi:uncharacterized protein (TIGR03083 family)